MDKKLTLRNFVANILEKYPKARDCYHYLFAVALMAQKKNWDKIGMGYKIEKTEDFLKEMSKKAFFGLDAIAREKRFQLEHFEHLRTVEWYSNQDKEQVFLDEIRKKSSTERWKSYLEGSISIKDLIEFTKTHKEFLAKEKTLKAE